MNSRIVKKEMINGSSRIARSITQNVGEAQGTTDDSEADDTVVKRRVRRSKYLNCKNRLCVMSMMSCFFSMIIFLAKYRMSILYNFSNDSALREQYRDPWNNLIVGMLLEDLDTFALTISVKHCSDDDYTTRPLYLVIASVDKIVLKKPITVDQDLSISGAVTWVGRSSMEIQLHVTQPPTPTPTHILEAADDDSVALITTFIFAARNYKTQRSAPVNRLNPETEREKSLYEAGEARNQLRKTKIKISGDADRRVEALLRIMPSFLEVDHVDFLIPVDVGDFLRFKSCVLYTESESSDHPLIHVEVVAHVTRPELRSSEVSNRFYFTFTVRAEAKDKKKMLFVNFVQLFLHGPHSPVISPDLVDIYVFLEAKRLLMLFKRRLAIDQVQFLIVALVDKEPSGVLVRSHLYYFIMDFLRAISIRILLLGADFPIRKKLQLPNFRGSLKEQGTLQMLTVGREAAIEVQVEYCVKSCSFADFSFVL
ncbi:Thioesterase/thiol ester dehydrase-isomerase superfamily protein [Perilla frutescens var. hirtella]|nr:Thioesterase/thiol ester dehydrase-isomerase superfamily protein [Perilla frutescens var. hirtella]